ncbi:hypothetical protein [Chryseobacterium oranimense]|uniref:hypothetical protein n=1 Tax=Chryseobacterium oranimense TaxID=421058 RepID=UPI002236003D|nr:hypothetical protein [Chryseobacterium oranimense]
MSQIEKLETALKKLLQIEDDSRWPIHDKKNGKNKKERENAQRDLDHQIFLAEHTIKQYNLLELKLGENRSAHDKTLWMDEFPKYFADEIKEFIKLTKEKIEELKQNQDGMD